MKGVRLYLVLLLFFNASISIDLISYTNIPETDSLNASIESVYKPHEEKANLKQWFEKAELAFGLTGILQGAAGIKNQLDPNYFDASTSMDIEVTLPVLDNARTFLHFEAGNGDGLDADITTLSGLNFDADDDINTRITELWFEQCWMENMLSLRLGKVDMTTNFDLNNAANSEQQQFLSPGFRNNSILKFPDDNTFGIMLWITPSDILEIGIGCADADADWNNVFNDLFTIVEVDIKQNLFGRDGTYRMYGWFNGKGHEVIGRSKNSKNNFGFGLSIDQELFKNVTLFGRYGVQHEHVSCLGSSYSAGIQVTPHLFNRDEDVIGLAFGVFNISKYQRDLDYLNSIASGNEQHLELYYNIKVSGYLNISPDIHWINNINGSKDNKDFWAIGMRSQISL